MSGTYRYLKPGRYELTVDQGTGPAGIRRPDGRNVVVGVEGGKRRFALKQAERVYYWWRGPAPRPGVRLASQRASERAASERTGDLDAVV
ncbi:MAG: hypothetical protein R6U63_04715 [Longimicrobiales bacterium]